MKEIYNQNLTCGYFGKLPVFRDFVKYNTGNNEILVLDKWLQEGLILAKQKLKNDWKPVYKKSLPLRFFYPFTGTDQFISGIIFPSNDKSDRVFPFLMFFNYNKNIFEIFPFYLIPLIFKNEYSVFEKIFNNIDNNILQSNLNELISQISSFHIEEPINESYQDFISNSSQELLWKRIFGDFSSEKKYCIINNIFDPKIKNSTLTLKFYFNSDDENDVLDICFLLNMVAISKSNFFLPAMFWSKDINNNISLYILPSKPVTINFLDIIYSNNDSDRILKVNEKLGSVPVSSKIKNLLNKKEISLKELLQVLNC